MSRLTADEDREVSDSSLSELLQTYLESDKCKQDMSSDVSDFEEDEELDYSKEVEEWVSLKKKRKELKSLANFSLEPLLQSHRPNLPYDRPAHKSVTISEEFGGTSPGEEEATVSRTASKFVYRQKLLMANSHKPKRKESKTSPRTQSKEGDNSKPKGRKRNTGQSFQPIELQYYKVPTRNVSCDFQRKQKMVDEIKSLPTTLSSGAVHTLGCSAEDEVEERPEIIELRSLRRDLRILGDSDDVNTDINKILMIWNVADLHSKLGEHRLSLKFISYSFDVLRKIGECAPELIIGYYYLMGTVYQRMEDPWSSIKYYSACLSTIEESCEKEQSNVPTSPKLSAPEAVTPRREELDLTSPPFYFSSPPSPKLAYKFRILALVLCYKLHILNERCQLFAASFKFSQKFENYWNLYPDVAKFFPKEKKITEELFLESEFGFLSKKSMSYQILKDSTKNCDLISDVFILSNLSSHSRMKTDLPPEHSDDFNLLATIEKTISRHKAPTNEQYIHRHILFQTAPNLMKIRLCNAFDKNHKSDVWPFSIADSPANIRIKKTKKGDEIIKSGTLEKLVERATYHAFTDPEYVSAFLLTYRTFTTPVELLSLLITRFNTPEQEFDDPIKAKNWEKKSKHIRLRVVNLLRIWLQNYFEDFKSSSRLFNTLRRFIDSLANWNEQQANTLKSTIKKRILAFQSESQLNFSVPPPPSIQPEEAAVLSITSMHPTEIARQLTLKEYDLLKAIKPQEFLGKAWTKHRTKEKTSPNIIASIAWFNKVSRWISIEILKLSNLKERADMIELVIHIAMECRKLNNFNAMAEVVCGLEWHPVNRLNQSWAQIGKVAKKNFEEMRKLLDSRGKFRTLRETLSVAGSPCIPYLGIFLTDIIGVEEGNPDYIDGDLINFGKQKLITEIISNVLRFQQTPYCLSTVNEIQEYLKNLPWWEDEEAEKRSEQLEARCEEKKKKKRKFRKSLLLTQAHLNEKSSVFIKDPVWGDLVAVKNYPFKGDSVSNIIFEKDSELCPIKAASLPKLVERITFSGVSNTYPLASAFFLTYPYFCNKYELLDLLKLRFNVPVPVDKSKLAKYHESKVLPVRIRVYNALKKWVTEYFYECCDKNFVAQIYSFAELMQKNDMKKLAELLKTTLDHKLEQISDGPSEDNQQDETFEPSTFDVHLTDYLPGEIASQLTLQDEHFFLKISSWELLPCNKNSYSQNLDNFIMRGKDKQRWMLTLLLMDINKNGLNVVSTLVTQFTDIASACFGMNNFFSCGMIIKVLNKVYDLKSIWESSSREKFQQLRSYFNFKANCYKLKAFIQDINPPSIPFTGMYVKIIKDLETKHEDMVGSLINFSKYALISENVFEFCSFQQANYSIVPHPHTQAYLKRVQSEAYSFEEINQSLTLLYEQTKPQRKRSQSRGSVHGFPQHKPKRRHSLNLAHHKLVQNHANHD